jgi:signal transduction histidine kinase
MAAGSITSLYFFFISTAHILWASGLLVLISVHLQENLKKTLLKEKLARKEQNNFGAIVSHEFNTPLGTIRNSVQLIENIEKKATPTSKAAMKRIHRATLRLSRLIDKTAIDQWMNATSDKLRCVDFNLIETIQSLSYEDNIDHQYTNQNLFLHGDPLLLSTAISSFIDNALKYSDNKDACYIAAGKNMKGQVYIDVYNDGKEISLQEHQRIFEKYYRSAEDNAISGAGFGLYITKKIVALHEADIKILSDNGTIFRITFK